MRYVQSTLNQRNEDRTYRIYVTDSLKTISENTAKWVSGSYMSKRYYDVLHPKQEETRSSEEIIGDIRGKLKSLE